MTGPLKRVEDGAFSPDLSLLVGASLDGRICLWRLRDSGQVEVLRGHECGGISFDFSPEGLNLASGAKDGVYLRQVRCNPVSACRAVLAGECLLGNACWAVLAR